MRGNNELVTLSCQRMRSRIIHIPLGHVSAISGKGPGHLLAQLPEHLPTPSLD